MAKCAPTSGGRSRLDPSSLADEDLAKLLTKANNEPITEDMIKADIAAKTNGMARGEVPIACTRPTMFIEVQGKLLDWFVAAWQDDFTGYIIDYGTHLDQNAAYFTPREAQHTLLSSHSRAGQEGAIYAGLESLMNQLLTRAWRRDDGTELHIDRCLIDANWGQSTDIVYQFCRQSTFGGIVMPSHGRYCGASSIPFSDYKRKPGERAGLNWRVSLQRGKRSVRHVLFDTNYWKSFVHARLAVSMGDPGCLSLFGRSSETHRLLADHLTSEYRVETEGRGRSVDEWKIRLAGSDNHWLDCMVGAAVAASMQGAVLFGTDVKRPKRRKVSFSEMQKRKRSGDTRPGTPT